MSAICPANSFRHGGGFSLIEVTIVLLMLGLLSAVVMPRMYQLYERLQYRYQVDQIVVALQSAGVQAFSRNEELDIAQYLNERQLIPQDWILITDGHLKVKANGVCLNGELELKTPREVARIQIQQPFCQVQVLDAL